MSTYRVLENDAAIEVCDTQDVVLQLHPPSDEKRDQAEGLAALLNRLTNEHTQLGADVTGATVRLRGIMAELRAWVTASAGGAENPKGWTLLIDGRAITALLDRLDGEIVRLEKAVPTDHDEEPEGEPT